MPPSPLALALRCVRIKNNAKIDRSMMDLIGYKLNTLTHTWGYKLTTLTHTMCEENPSLSKASHHFTVVRAFGAKKKKIVSTKALNCSNVFLGHRSGRIEALTPCFFIMYTWSSIRATSGETTRIALLPPSLCSIRNGRVW